MKGICFKEHLFNAVINGTKTQTRRICSIQPLNRDNWIPSVMMCTTDREQKKNEGKTHFVVKENEYLIGKYDDRYFNPRYQVGETVYLKEPYYLFTDAPYCYNEPVYKYGNKQESSEWQNKLFMPAKYARYFIKITDVRCERLQDISEEDCFKEGIKPIPQKYNGSFIYNYGGSDCENTPKRAYAALIDKISGKGTWESNPFVWVYDFNLKKQD
jgi:hypothetical protein